MIIKTIIFGILLLILAVFAIATSSIGIQCYNKNEATMKEYKGNRTYIITNLVFAIIGALVALYTTGYGFYHTLP
jgi:uncharacterized membrane protein YidH (DUF202 family)